MARPRNHRQRQLTRRARCMGADTGPPTAHGAMGREEPSDHRAVASAAWSVVSASADEQARDRQRRKAVGGPSPDQVQRRARALNITALKEISAQRQGLATMGATTREPSLSEPLRQSRQRRLMSDLPNRRKAGTWMGTHRMTRAAGSDQCGELTVMLVRDGILYR